MCRAAVRFLRSGSPFQLKIDYSLLVVSEVEPLDIIYPDNQFPDNTFLLGYWLLAIGYFFDSKSESGQYFLIPYSLLSIPYSKNGVMKCS